jgi:hypothetical protein
MTISREWPTDEEIRAIASNEKIPLSAEAYEIAHQYSRISQALSANLLGEDDLSWCGFAQWSSRAVGSELRLDDHSKFLQKLSRQYHVPVFAERLFRLLTLTLLGGSYGVGLSIANRSIFAEMASFHTHILSGVEEPAIVKVTPLNDYPPLLEDLGDEGLALLRTAHSLLSRVKYAPGPLRSELILGANIALSAYEQKRVQPALEYVFYRPIRWTLQVSWRMPYLYATRHSSERFKFYGKAHDKQAPAMRSIEDSWVQMYSRTLWIKTAVDTIMLGKPLNFPQGSTPPLLRAASTFQNKEVADLIQQYGPPDPTALKGVSNWLDYTERMRFIVTYFMVYQQIEQMFHEPLFKPRRRWRKPHIIDPLGCLEFRTVPLWLPTEPEGRPPVPSAEH